MNTQRERPPFSTISGTMVQLGTRDTVAIYRWNDLSWVAHFRDGRGQLSDATTWYRANAARLRESYAGFSVAALTTVTMLTPEMIEQIARLHRQAEAEAVGRARAFLSAAFGQACAKIASRLHGWRGRLIHRIG